MCWSRTPRRRSPATGQAVTDIFTTLEQTFGTVPDDISQSPFMARLSALRIHGGTKKSLLTHYTGFLALLQRYQREGIT